MKMKVLSINTLLFLGKSPPRLCLGAVGLIRYSLSAKAESAATTIPLAVVW